MIKRKLQESDRELSQVLMNLLNNHGLYKTLTITGLNTIQLFDRIGPMVINSDLAYEIILELWVNHDVLKTKVGDYGLTHDPFEGTIRWVYYNKETDERMYSICTPFWDGNAWIPINVEEYERQGDSIEKQGEYAIKAPSEFTSIKQIINWYNTYYINSVYKVLNKFLESYREDYNEY